MNNNDQNKKMADLIFPEELKDTSEYETIYPQRALSESSMVTRLGPSPTGFIHLGNLYTAYVNERLAHQSEGTFYLRIEDTDDKREVEGAADALITALNHYGINFDEGVSLKEEIGNYGPYYQSSRKEIYHAYAKKLLVEGKAYPCFLSEEDIEEIRADQEKNKLTPGIYGDWAKYRDMAYDEIKEIIKSGKPYVLRYREDPDTGDQFIHTTDGIRGQLRMPKNIMDFVILKKNKMPTYHFAHVVDDHLMRTSHVIRGEEWLSSLPIHLTLFEALNLAPPIYCHTTVLMKKDGDIKRKLSKRKDPELSLEFYKELGYHPAAIKEYLLTIINSNYEEWRMENPDTPAEDFKLNLDKMGTSGILFDLDKLNNLSKDVLVKIPSDDIASFLIQWAEAYKPEVFSLLDNDRERLPKILDIGRSGNKPRKDLSYAAQIWEHIAYFYDDFYKINDKRSDHIPEEDVAIIFDSYLKNYDHNDDRSAWFEKIRAICGENGYAIKPKDFKKNPDGYKGHIGDVSELIRLALVGRKDSPDIYEIQQILGEDAVRERIKKAKDIL